MAGKFELSFEEHKNRDGGREISAGFCDAPEGRSKAHGRQCRGLHS